MAAGAKGATNGADAHIDEDLHSRQLAVYGRESMARMAQAKVLISGMRGLGAEIAKNVILAGVKAVTLHDADAVEVADLSGGRCSVVPASLRRAPLTVPSLDSPPPAPAAHFYLHEDDVGKNRAEACRDRMQELNPSVTVTASSSPLNDGLISQHSGEAQL